MEFNSVAIATAGFRVDAAAFERLEHALRTKVSCENGISHVWWHHRFLSVAFAWFYPYLVFTTVHICYVGGFALMATSIAYGRCVFGEFQLFSWSW